MPKAEMLQYCACCGREKPSYDYAPGSLICSLCDTLTAREAVMLCRESFKREHSVATFTKAGRKQSRIAAKMLQYSISGKRCTACHGYKAPDAFNKCAPAPDGLQPICRTCHTLWVASSKAGGPIAWHAVRDALRAVSAAKAASAGVAP